MSMTERQRRFVDAYVLVPNGKRAAIAAGYSEHTAEVQASRLLRHPAVAAELSRRVQPAPKAPEPATDITVDRIKSELARIGFANMLDYIAIGDDGDPYINLANLTRDQAAAIVEVTVDDYKEGRGEFARDVRSIKFKLAPKAPALIKLGEHLGMFRPAAPRLPGAGPGAPANRAPLDAPAANDTWSGLLN